MYVLKIKLSPRYSYTKNVCQNWFCQTPFSISKITRQTGAASPKECLQKAHLQMYVLKPAGFWTFKFKYVSINSVIIASIEST